MTRGRSIPSAVVLAAGAAFLVYGLWSRVGLPFVGVAGDAPFPGLWRWFFATWLPALFPVYTLVHARLSAWGERRGEAAEPLRRGRIWDRWSYLGLLLFLGLLLTWRWLPNWRLVFGAVFVGLLFAKTAGLVVTLYRAFAVGPGSDRRPDEDAPILPRQLFIAAFLLYAFLAPYVITAVSTTGDEHIYLLGTVSLYTDGDLDIANNVERRDWAKFYWGRPSPSEWQSERAVFPMVLLPGYTLSAGIVPGYPLAGRLGATLTIALVAALLALQVYRLCRELGASAPAAFWAWLVVALTPPILVNASHLYPDLPAALLAVVGMRAVRRVPHHVWSGTVLLGATAAALAVVKLRYLALGAGLVLAGLARLLARRKLLGYTLLGFIGIAYVVIRVDPWFLWSFQDRFLRQHGYQTSKAAVRSLGRWKWSMTEALVGLGADQEFGLVQYGPHWLLVLVGAIFLWRRSRTIVLALLGVTGCYVLVLVQQRWMQWDAGWTPPPRFILPVVPLLAPFIAEAFEHGRGRFLAAVNTVWLVWCGLIGFFLAVVPFWRYNGLTGRSRLLAVLGDRLELDFARFLPSVRVPNPWTWPLLTLGAVALVAACVVWDRRRDPTPVGWGQGAVVLSPIRGVALVLGLALVWLTAAAVVPTSFLEGVAMRHSTGIQFGSYTWDPNVWVMKRNAEISERIVTWPGRTEIAIVAGGIMSNGGGGQMALLLDGQHLHTWVLEAGRDEWATRTYVTTTRTTFGRPMLRLQFTDLADRHPSPGGPVTQHAFLGQIRLRRMAAAEAAGSAGGSGSLTE